MEEEIAKLLMQNGGPGYAHAAGPTEGLAVNEKYSRGLNDDLLAAHPSDGMIEHHQDLYGTPGNPGAMYTESPYGLSPQDQAQTNQNMSQFNGLQRELNSLFGPGMGHEIMQDLLRFRAGQELNGPAPAPPQMNLPPAPGIGR